MIRGSDLKVGDVVYDSECFEWFSEHQPDGEGPTFDDEFFANWLKRVALEDDGHIVLTSNWHKDEHGLRHVWVHSPDLDRCYGETPQEAAMLDCETEAAYMHRGLAFFAKVVDTLKEPDHD